MPIKQKKPLIFISYRRNDSGSTTTKMYGKLIDIFGENNIARDIDDIPPGVDFRESLRQFISTTRVLVVVIGPRWTSFINDSNESLEKDYVLEEIQSAINEGVHIVPLLVGGAKHPEEADLPDDIKNLAYLQSVKIGRFFSFEKDMEKLAARIKPILYPNNVVNTAKSTAKIIGQIVLGLIGMAFLGFVFAALNS